MWPFTGLVIVSVTLSVSYLYLVWTAVHSKDPGRWNRAKKILDSHRLTRRIASVTADSGTTLSVDYRPALPLLEPAETDPRSWKEVSEYSTAIVPFSDHSMRLVHVVDRCQDGDGKWWYLIWWGDGETIRNGWYLYDPAYMKPSN
jgi:hypothetical protein